MNNLNFINGTAVALGNFDGIHIGHMAVLNETKKYSDRGLVR
jgi:FAD synthase